jgi:hypothetical protein
MHSVLCGARWGSSSPPFFGIPYHSEGFLGVLKLFETYMYGKMFCQLGSDLPPLSVRKFDPQSPLGEVPNLTNPPILVRPDFVVRRAIFRQRASRNRASG